MGQGFLFLRELISGNNKQYPVAMHDMGGIFDLLDERDLHCSGGEP